MTRQANLAGIAVPETLANIDSAATLRVICRRLDLRSIEMAMWTRNRPAPIHLRL
jgi:hypothetical protein